MVSIVYSFCGCGSRGSPCSRYARTIGAVASARKVRERSPRSANVYISFETMSEPCPEGPANRAVSSNTGVSMRRYPYRPQRRSNSRLTSDHAGCSDGRMSCVPRGASNLVATLRAQLGEERVPRKLGAEGGRRPVAGVDDSLGRKAVYE